MRTHLPLPKGDRASKFLAHAYCGQTARGRPQPRLLCVRWGPSPLPKRGRSLPPQFSAHFYCGQTAGWMKLVLGVVVGFSPGYFVLDGDPAPFPKRVRSPLSNFRPISIVVNGWKHQDVTWYEGRPWPRRLCVRWRPVSYTHLTLPTIYSV